MKKNLSAKVFQSLIFKSILVKPKQTDNYNVINLINALGQSYYPKNYVQQKIKIVEKNLEFCDFYY